MAISVASAKNKGRKLQQTVRDAILKVFPDLTRDDVRSCPMGSTGDDIQLSAAAKDVFPVAVECKARAKGFTLLYDAMDQANRNDGRLPVVVFKQDRRKPLVVVDLDVFMRMCAQVEW